MGPRAPLAVADFPDDQQGRNGSILVVRRLYSEPVVRHDLGMMEHTCLKCGALHWLNEHVQKAGSTPGAHSFQVHNQLDIGFVFDNHSHIQLWGEVKGGGRPSANYVHFGCLDRPESLTLEWRLAYIRAMNRFVPPQGLLSVVTFPTVKDFD